MYSAVGLGVRWWVPGTTNVPPLSAVKASMANITFTDTTYPFSMRGKSM